MAYLPQKQRQKRVVRVPSPRKQNRDLDASEEIRMVLIGKTGKGKSSSGNTILNRTAFKTICSACSVTSECEKAKGVVDGRRVAVIDTPGIYDTKYKEVEVVIKKVKECISLSAPGPHVFLIVIDLSKFTEEEQKTIELLQHVFGDKAADYSLVLFTHGDQLGSTKIEDFFSQSQQLSHLIAKCNQRYHVFNNKDSDKSQVTQLLEKIIAMVNDNGGTFYTNEMFQEAERAIQEQTKRNMEASAERKLRVEEKLRSIFKKEQLQEKLEALNEKYKREAREMAEKINKFIVPSLIVVGAEVGATAGATAGAPGGPVCLIVGVTVGAAAGALAGIFVPGAVIALKNKCTVQ